MIKRRIHEDEYMSSDIWKYNVDEPEYKRGSLHNKIGMIIMWSFYGIVIAQLIHVITVIPLVLGGIGWLAWKRIQSKVQTCQNCGSSFLSSQITCPVCGENMQYDKDNFDNIPASSATIDIKSENID